MAGDGAQAPAKETAELISSTVANRHGQTPRSRTHDRVAALEEAKRQLRESWAPD
jgi:hypothetical protein